MCIRIVPPLAVCLAVFGMTTVCSADPTMPKAVPNVQSIPSSPASSRIEGELIKIEGAYYVVRGTGGQEVRLLISADTELGSTFQPGDRIEVLISPVEYAIAIRPFVSSRNVPETASHLVRGTLSKIDGRYYVIRDAAGKEFHVLVSKDTELAGQFGPGEQIEVFTAPVEHAVAIKPAK